MGTHPEPPGPLFRGETRSRTGASFVEVVLALALAALVLTSVAALFLSSRRANDAAEKMRTANALASDRLEQLLAVRFDDPRLAPGLHDDDLPSTLPDPETGAPSAIPSVFRRSYRVRQLALAPASSVPRDAPFPWVPVTSAGVRYDFKRVDVTVEPSISRPGLGRAAARVSALRANPAPGEILSEDTDS